MPPQTQNTTRTNPVLGGGGFHHVCIKTRDWDRTREFYQDVLGFAEKIAWGAAPSRAVLLDAGAGDYLEVFEDLEFSPAAVGAVLHFALRTTRLDEVTERARAHGQKITVEPKDIVITSAIGPVPIRLSFIAGPSGELIELFQNDRT